MVHPLCKQTPMQKHLAALMVGDLAETRHKRCRQIPRSIDSVRMQIRDQFGDECRRGSWSRHTTLQLAHQTFALVDTTN